jgi:hypothetical protein
MQLAGIECQAQRLAGSQQVRLPDDILQGMWTQAFRQRRMTVGHGLWRLVGKKILGAHGRDY